MRLAPGAGRVVRDGTASAGRALLLTGSGSARTAAALKAAARIVVRVRARPCAGSPRLRVTVDGSRAAVAAITARHWHDRTVAAPLQPGKRTIELGLANPYRSETCRRGLLVDTLVLQPLPSGGGAIWVPEPTTTWQWQLTTPVDVTVDAQMYDIDLFDNSAAVVASLHRRGSRVVCYFSAGTVEPDRADTGAFPASVIGNRVAGWPEERWLDIRRLDVLGPIVEQRLDLCKAKGFDGVEVDNVDGYTNRTGFPLTGADQLRFNRFLAAAAHARGLSIGLKNDVEQAAALEPDFDWALDEQCVEYDECELLQPFVAADKAVFEVEYGLDPARFCPQTRTAGFMSMQKHVRLDAWRRTCW